MSDIAEQAEELGMVEILNGRRAFDAIRLDLYRKAQNVSWLSTHPGLPPESKMEEEVGKCLEQGTNFRIMGWSGDSISKDRVELLTRIKQLGGKKGNIEIRYYKEEPNWYVQIIDDTIYAQPYLHGASMFKTPIFVFKRIPEWYGFYNRFETHFSEIWDSAVDIESSIAGKDSIET
ncbi:hypothetical protein ACFLUP_00995 [Chloroflexota bacterium]